jgi:hypothetical protein
MTVYRIKYWFSHIMKNVIYQSSSLHGNYTWGLSVQSSAILPEAFRRLPQSPRES